MNVLPPTQQIVQVPTKQSQKVVRNVHLLKISIVVVGMLAALSLAMVIFLFTNQSVSSRIVEDGGITETVGLRSHPLF